MQTPLPYGASIYPEVVRSALTLELDASSVREPPSDYLPSPPNLDALLAQVRRPLAMRERCFYRRGLLDAYQPNATRYLPAKTVTHLHLIGTTLYHRHPPGAYARARFSRLAVDLALTSVRLEGGAASHLRRTRFIINHATALSWLLNPASDLSLDGGSLLDLSAMLGAGLEPSLFVAGPRLRTRAACIQGSPYTPPAIAASIQELYATVMQKARLIEDPFEQAFFILIHLPYLHPFAESHPRTARMAANIALMRHNLAPLVFLEVSESAYAEALLVLYECARIEVLRELFVEAYERSCGRFRTVEGRKQLI